MMFTRASTHNDADWLKLPHAESRNRIGIFGGSFNPPHSGHRLVAETALKRLRLDQIWWLVTPGNPLKSQGELLPLAERIELVGRLTRHPGMKATAFEVVLGSSYTAQTVEMLRLLRPDLRFVWVMGADNLAGFHRWKDWRGIAGLVPIAVIDRPGASLSTLSAPMAKAFGNQRLPERDAAMIAGMKPPVWTFVHAPLDTTSSTELRNKR